MEFFFCEKCGKRLTDRDIQAGKARHKQVKGVFCADCAKGVMTVEFEAISPEMIEQFRKEQREKQRRGATSGAPPSTAQVPARRPAPGSRPSIPVPAARRSDRPRFAGEGADSDAGPSRKPLIAAALAAVAVVLALTVLFMRGGPAPAIKDRVAAPDVPLAPQETADASLPKELPHAKTAEAKAVPSKTVAEKPPAFAGATRTVELFPTDDVEEAKSAGEIYTDRPEIAVRTNPITAACLRFDLSTLNAKPLAVRLALCLVREPEAGSVVLVHRRYGDDWTEGNYKDKRSKLRDRGYSGRLVFRAAGPAEEDITSVVDARSDAEPVVTLYLQPAIRGCDMVFASREGPAATRPRLIVEIPGTGAPAAQAHAAPPPQADDGAVYLADHKQTLNNFMEPAKTVSHDGKEFQKSLPSRDIPKMRAAIVLFDINGAYERFQSAFALVGEKTGRLTFFVYCDGKEMWHGEKSPCDIDITGAKVLKLSIWKDSDGPAELKGVWLSPRVYAEKPAEAPSGVPASPDGEADAAEAAGAAPQDPGLGEALDLTDLPHAVLENAKSVRVRARNGSMYFKSIVTVDLDKIRTATATFNLNGNYAAFRCRFQETPAGIQGLQVSVLCGGKPAAAPKDNQWAVDLAGVKELKLVISYPEGGERRALGSWLRPKVYKAVAKE